MTNIPGSIRGHRDPSTTASNNPCSASTRYNEYHDDCVSSDSPRASFHPADVRSPWLPITTAVVVVLLMWVLLYLYYARRYCSVTIRDDDPSPVAATGNDQKRANTGGGHSKEKRSLILSRIQANRQCLIIDSSTLLSVRSKLDHYEKNCLSPHVSVATPTDESGSQQKGAVDCTRKDGTHSDLIISSSLKAKDETEWLELILPPGKNETRSDDECRRHRNVPNHCAICLLSYAEGDTVVWSANEDCRHVYHQNCLVDYLMTTEAAGMEMTCPTCRRSGFIKEEEEDGLHSDGRLHNVV